MGRWFAVAGRPRVQRALRIIVVLTIALNVAYALSYLFATRGQDGYDTFWDGWEFTVASFLPAALVAIRAATERRARGACWWISAGIVLNLAANLIYTYHDQNLNPIPYPGPADAAYLASYVAFALGLTLFMRAQIKDDSRATRLDGLVVGLAAGSVAVALWFEPVLHQSGDVAQVVVGLAYPIFDVIFVVIVFAGLATQKFRPTLPTTAFLAGAAVFAFGDVVYLNQVATNSYQGGTWLELTWAFGILLFGLAPWLPTRRRRIPAAETRAGVAALPTLGALASLVVVALGLTASVPPLASWLAIGSIAFALVRMLATVRELRRANESFVQARTDDLTSLMNRRGFAELVDRRLAGGAAHSVLVVDLDGFKEVNDSLGHPAGDALLAVVAERFARAVPPRGEVARLGGDEFGIIVPGDGSEARTAARNLLATLANPIALEAMSIRVGASIGIATAPDHGTTREELLRAADVAMYEAKVHRHGFSVYSVERDPHSRDRLHLIEDLRTAIDRRAFEMHYQPTVDVATGAVVGMEALIRWQHPTRGLLLPDAFIPLAERVGLIPAITRAVLDQSIAHLAATLADGHDLNLSVNVSASDLVDDDLPTYVHATLGAHAVPAERLTLEITETALATDPVRAKRTLDALRAEGVRVSIDDFGVGYSSMSQLMELPVDELKLDRSFIGHLHDDVRAQAILSATVALGRSLGLHVVAEGVETTAALDAARSRGVDTVQGFLFSPGLAAGDFVRYVEGAQQSAGTASAPAGRPPRRTGSPVT